MVGVMVGAAAARLRAAPLALLLIELLAELHHLELQQVLRAAALGRLLPPPEQRRDGTSATPEAAGRSTRERELRGWCGATGETSLRE